MPRKPRPPGRPGADHRHVVQAGTRAGLDPDGLGDLSVRRILQHPPVEHDDHWQRRRGGAGLFQQRLSRPGVLRIEAERNHVAAQQVPDLVRAGGPLLAHHPHDFGPGKVRPGPLLQQRGDRQVELLVWHRRRPAGISVDVAERDGLQDRLRRRSVFPMDQQEALGRAMELTDPRQQLYPGQRRHRFARQHDADQALVVAKPGEQTGRIIGRSNADDLVIGPVPLAQLPLHDAWRPQVVIDDQQDWSTWHGRHLRGLACRLQSQTPFPAAAASSAHTAPELVTAPDAVGRSRRDGDRQPAANYPAGGLPLQPNPAGSPGAPTAPRTGQCPSAWFMCSEVKVMSG